MKPVTMWAVVSPIDDEPLSYLGMTRAQAIDRFLSGKNWSATDWNYWKKKGYTVQRVTVTVNEKEKE